MTSDNKTDPDLFTLASISLSIASVVLSVLPLIDRQKKSGGLTDSEESSINSLREGVQNGLDATNDLLFVLQQDASNELQMKFRPKSFFGVRPALSSRMGSAVSKMCLSISSTYQRIISIVERQPDIGAQIAVMIGEELGHVPVLIDSMMEKDRTIESVFEDSIIIQRAFLKVLDRLLGYNVSNTPRT